MAVERHLITVPTSFFPPGHIIKGSRFSMDDTIGIITDAKTVADGVSLSLTVEIES
jgi:hypothetical protein